MLSLLRMMYVDATYRFHCAFWPQVLSPPEAWIVSRLDRDERARIWLRAFDAWQDQDCPGSWLFQEWVALVAWMLLPVWWFRHGISARIRKQRTRQKQAEITSKGTRCGSM